jgi:probable rRNA maturation factor
MSPGEDSLIIYRRAGRGFSRKTVRATVNRLQLEVAEGMPFSCLLTDDRELRRLNRTFLNKDYPTDVLSFPEEEALGEIAVSVERATEQAAEHGHSPETEIGILLLHGLLHLMGLDHERDRGKMRRTELSWRKKLGLPAGLIERTDK